MRISFRQALLGATIGTVLAAPSWGQTFGQITGLVTDSSGGVLVGASVTVTNPETSFTRTDLTNSSGAYSFQNLQPGVHNIRVISQGFQTSIRNNVELQVEQTARLDFQLTVGAVAEAVEITGGAPLLNTEETPTGRAAHSLAWAGLANTYYWLDPTRRLAGVLLTQILPFADDRVLRVFDRFETAVYA